MTSYDNKDDPHQTTLVSQIRGVFSRGRMSGWNEGGRSDKGNDEEKKKCLTGILNNKGSRFHSCVFDICNFVGRYICHEKG